MGMLSWRMINGEAKEVVIFTLEKGLTKGKVNKRNIPFSIIVQENLWLAHSMKLSL